MLKTELIRKSIHFLIALIPLVAACNKAAALALLAGGTAFYTAMELLRRGGMPVPLISRITVLASRERDTGFVQGPVTLGMGALLTVALYPAPVAAIAIYALAFGDGFSSIVGKWFGRLRPAFLRGKSLEGSCACFAATFVAALLVSSSLRTALIAALAATITEALPLKDYDNLAIPLAVGLALLPAF
jgi:dolichol kinase